MKSIIKLTTLAFILVSSHLAVCQNVNSNGFELMGNNRQTILLNQAFTKNTQIAPFAGRVSTIFGLALKANITFNDAKSSVRVILLDKMGQEYLVYETYPMMEETSSVSVDNLCEETGILDGVQPEALLVEVRNANISISSITWSAAAEQGIDLNKAKKDKKYLQNNWKISQINKTIKAKGLSWVAGETGVSALTYSGKKKLYGQSTFPSGIEFYVGGILSAGASPSLKAGSLGTMVEEWDWRNRHNQNWVTSVKNQASCGSCWAFAATGATEAVVNLFYNQLLNKDLSEQTILSCSGGGTCSGGWPYAALDYIKNTGIVDEGAFPYTATDLTCSNKSASPADQFKIGGRINFGGTEYPATEDNLKKMMIKYGPASGGLSDWSHAMTLVGWKVVKEGDRFLYCNTDKIYSWYTVPAGAALIGKTIWAFKNSWGATWGDAGYIYVETAITNVAWTHALVAPVTSLKQTYTVQCTDNDHDGFYWWGLGPKPANCPPCPDLPDGNDADPTLGPLNSYGYCSPITTTVPPPVTDFAASNTAPVQNTSITFTDLSTNTPGAWAWTFDGGTPSTSTVANPVVSYATAGTYNVTLVATNSAGSNTKTKTGYITVSPVVAAVAPVADFSADKTAPIENTNVNFTDLSTNKPVAWAWTFDGGTPATSTAVNPVVSYKTAGKYNVTLMVTNSNGNNTKIKTSYITVNPYVPVYCTSKGTAVTEWISQVSMNGSTYPSNSTGSAGYDNLTANIFNVNAGKSYSVTMTPGYTGRSSFWCWSVWIDLNNDADFNDAGEQVIVVSKTKTAVTKTINIPATASTGPKRMRVSMKRSSMPTACEIFTNGEVKDYTVNISAAAAANYKSATLEIQDIAPAVSFTLFPNPAREIVNLRVQDVSDKDTYTIYSAQGSLICKKPLDSGITQVDISNLPTGTYFVKVMTGEQTFNGKFIKNK